MDRKYKLIVDSLGREKFKFNEPLKNYTALEVGGPAKLFFVAFSLRELVQIVKLCRQLSLPFFIFGTGSKMMISDSGYDGLVIKNRSHEIATISVKGKATRFGIGVEEALVEADSGVSISKFCEYLDSQNLDSNQFSNTAGSIGGNLLINRFLQSKAKSIKVLDQTSEIDEISAMGLKVNRQIILSAVFKIKAKVF